MKKKYFVVIALLSACVIPGCSQFPASITAEGNETSNYQIENFQEKFTYKNPALLAGSDLLSVLRRLYSNQDYNSMLLLTSRHSINRYGERRILEFFKSSNLLGPYMKLKSIIYLSDSSMCSMRYEINIFGTTHLRNVNCSIEGDTAKLYLCNLKSVFCN